MENLWEGPVVLGTQLEVLGPKRQGKVRDIYHLGDKILLVATDRISAFDVILPDGIPGKGYVLTQMSRFWFEWLWQMEDIVPHHLVSTKVEKFPSECHPYRRILEGRTMLVQKATPCRWSASFGGISPVLPGRNTGKAGRCVISF